MSQVTQPRVRRVWVVLGASVLSSLLLATPALAGDVQLSGLQSAPTHQRFIVKYRDGSAPVANTTALASSLKSAAAGLASSQGRALGLQEVRKLAVGPTLVRTDRPLDQAESELLMRKLAADPNVEYVEVDQIMRATLTPNDTRFSEQWGFGTSNASINVQPAWDKATGTGVVVAVIDTGITNHPDLNANILPGYDFISDAAMARDGGGRDSNPNDEGDWYGANECGSGIPASNSSWHGTHVAGTVAAVTNNSTGVAGTAFNAKVVPVRVLGKCGGYTSDIADAIVWASGGTVSGVPANANPAEVINMSLGGGGTCSATYQNAINGAVSRGTTVVVAAGNSNTNVSSSVPANCANVIAVAATTSAGARASFSNYGAGIDISGPGQSILSTLNTGTTTPGSATICVLQRHLDGGAACGRCGCTDAVGSAEPAESGTGRKHHQEHRTPAAWRLLGWLRRRHRRRQRGRGCGDQWRWPEPGRQRAAEQRAGDRPGRRDRCRAELHRRRSSRQHPAARGDQWRQR